MVAGIQYGELHSARVGHSEGNGMPAIEAQWIAPVYSLMDCRDLRKHVRHVLTFTAC